MRRTQVHPRPTTALLVAAVLAALTVGCSSGPRATPASPTSGASSSPAVSASSVDSASLSPRASPTASRTPNPSPTASRSSNPSPTASRTPNPSPTASRTPTTSRTPSPTPTRSGSAAPTGTRCGELSLADQVGQLFVMGVAATGATRSQLDLLAEQRVGAVILMGNTDAPVDGVRRVTDAIRAAGRQPRGVQVLVSADQEGGQVRRLRGRGFSDMPSARTQATWSDGTLTARATSWARELDRAGVDADLAPVADVVPASVGTRNKPIGALGRGYGSDPGVVGAKASAFVRGMHAGHQAVAVKHFPGLGRVIGNTDFATKVVDDRTTRDDPLLGGFDAAQRAGADMIMVSTAYYNRIDAAAPAAFSSTVITGMLRRDRNYSRVVVSDDLGVAKAVSFLPPGERAVRFLSAGGDLVINVDPGTTDDMVRAVTAKAKSDPAFAQRVRQSAERVLVLKTRYGLADCG